jgi:hypothetical protein
MYGDGPSYKTGRVWVEQSGQRETIETRTLNSRSAATTFYAVRFDLDKDILISNEDIIVLISLHLQKGLSPCL